MDREDRLLFRRELDELGMTSGVIATSLFASRHLGMRGLRGSGPLESYLQGIFGTDDIAVVGARIELSWNEGQLASRDHLHITAPIHQFQREFQAGQWPALERSWRGWRERVLESIR